MKARPNLSPGRTISCAGGFPGSGSRRYFGRSWVWSECRGDWRRLAERVRQVWTDEACAARLTDRMTDYLVRYHAMDDRIGELETFLKRAIPCVDNGLVRLNPAPVEDRELEP